MNNRITTFLLLAALAIPSLGQTSRDTAYTRSGQNVTLNLNWTAQNYGSIQWQSSKDGGLTWKDISGQTSTTYTFQPQESTLYRAHIVGDPSCPPINIEREIVPINFTVDVDTVTYNSATLTITNTDIPKEDVVEYGYATNISNLSWSYSLMPLTKVGESLPTEDQFQVICQDLKPGRSYSIRFYIKTKDGSIVFGPGKTVTTLAGLEWHSENWTIEKNSIQGRFALVGDGEISDIHFYYGTSENELNEGTYSLVENDIYETAPNLYATQLITGLQAGTSYIFKVSANIDGEVQTIEHTVKTMPDYSSYVVDETVKPVSHKIDWGTQHVLTKISDPSMTAVEYPRLVRLANGDLLLTYHGGTPSNTWKNCYYRISHDDGKTWENQVMIFNGSVNMLGSGFYRICNPQATVLDNGWVILSATADANPETNYNCKVITIISKDNCRTWSDPVIVGRGRNWEPHVVQLPGGELELLVSLEAKWWTGGVVADQEIVVSRSTDYGQTWTAFRRAAHCDNVRDGMAVPILMQGNKGVLFSIESPKGGLSPSFVHRNLTEEYDSNSWNRVNSSKRWATGLNNGAGGPYSVQLPTGEIVVVAHTNQAGSVWQTNRPQVSLFDNTGHNRKYFTLPVTTGNPLNINEGAYYNSLWVKDAEHIWLLVTRVTYNGTTRGRSSIEYLEGTIVPAE